MIRLFYVGGSLDHVSDDVGRYLQFAYSGGLLQGVRLHTQTAGGYTTTYDHAPSADGHMVTVSGPGAAPHQAIAVYKYDGNGNQIELDDPNGNATLYGYNAENELIHLIHPSPDGTSLSYDYDNNGNLITQTDEDNHTTTYDYDAFNRLWHATDPLNRQTTDTYWPGGALKTRTDPLGQVTTYGYYANDWPHTIAYNPPSTPGVTYTYYGNGQRATLADGTGTTTYLYNDSLHRLTDVTDGGGRHVGYAYDNAGNRTALTYPDGSPFREL